MTGGPSEELGAAVPLVELDRCLAPIRRAVTWTSRDVSERASTSRHLESIGKVWLDRARGLALPEAIGDALGELESQLEGLEQADEQERCAKMSAMYQSLTRIDAVLGLPLSSRGPYRPFPKPVASGGEVREKQGKGKRGKESRGSGASTKQEDSRASEQPRASGAPHGWRGRLWAPLEKAGVAEELASRLASAGVVTVLDLLWTRPVAYERVGKPIGAGMELPGGERVAVGGRVALSSTTISPQGERTTEIRLEGKGSLRTQWEARPAVSEGDRVVVVGNVSGDDPALLVGCELASPASSKEVYLPSYGLDGVEDAEVRGVVARLARGLREVRDSFPGGVRGDTIPLREALQTTHAAPDEAARSRMALNEVFSYFLAQAYSQVTQDSKQGTQAVPTQLSARLAREVPYLLSDDEQVLLEALRRDLRRGTPMRRLLVGEENPRVWAICIHALVTVAETRAQVVVVSESPREVESMSLIYEAPLKALGIVTKSIVGPVSDPLRDALKKGDVHVVFGTPEVLDPEVGYRRLALVVCQESSWRGSVSSRLSSRRGGTPNVLLQSRNPVPPEVRWHDYASFATSVLPVVAREVRTQRVPEARRGEVHEAAVKALERGKQVLFVFPRPQGGDALVPAEAQQWAAALGEGAFSDYRVEVLHGGGSKEERRRVLGDFYHRRLDVLVVTGRLEELPWWPELGAVVMEQAHRASLDRLRHFRAMARTAGGDIWWIVPDELNASDAERLAVWERLGAMDSGQERGVSPDHAIGWRWFDPDRDQVMMQKGSEAAQRLMQEDPKLRRPPHTDVARWVRTVWGCLDQEGDCPVPAPVEGEKRRRRRRRR